MLINARCIAQDVQDRIFRDIYYNAFNVTFFLASSEYNAHCRVRDDRSQYYELFFMVLHSKTTYSRLLWIRLTQSMLVHEKDDARGMCSKVQSVGVGYILISGSPILRFPGFEVPTAQRRRHRESHAKRPQCHISGI